MKSPPDPIISGLTVPLCQEDKPRGITKTGDTIRTGQHCSQVSAPINVGSDFSPGCENPAGKRQAPSRLVKIRGGGHGRGLQGQVETGTKPPVQPRRPKPGDHTPPSKTCWETPAPQQAGPLLSRDTGPLEQPAFNTYSTTETADGSKRKSSVFFHWLDSTGPW